MISKQSIFVSDRASNMQLGKMQNKIHRPLVRIQYICTTPNVPTLFTQSSQANNLGFIFFAEITFKFRPQTSIHTIFQ